MKNAVKILACLTFGAIAYHLVFWATVSLLGGEPGISAEPAQDVYWLDAELREIDQADETPRWIQEASEASERAREF